MPLKKPTVLYVKRHKVTGLMYFGKTTNIKDVYKYTGSGTHWKRHVSKHGKDNIETIWVSEVFTDEENITEFATFFSDFFDVVNNKQWANLIVENGTDGGRYLYGDDNPSRDPLIRKKISESLMGHPGVTNRGFLDKHHSDEAKEKIRSAHKGKPKSEEFKENLRQKSLLRPSKQCKHCDRFIKVNLFTRFHDENCKLNKDRYAS